MSTRRMISSEFLGSCWFTTTPLSPAPLTRMVKKYGLPMLVTSDEELKAYLDTILKQVQGELQTRAKAASMLALDD